MGGPEGDDLGPGGADGGDGMTEINEKDSSIKRGVLIHLYFMYLHRSNEQVYTDKFYHPEQARTINHS
jgi:hypothetical protein